MAQTPRSALRLHHSIKQLVITKMTRFLTLHSLLSVNRKMKLRKMGLQVRYEECMQNFGLRTRRKCLLGRPKCRCECSKAECEWYKVEFKLTHNRDQ
jgi:hypothetical protein